MKTLNTRRKELRAQIVDAFEQDGLVKYEVDGIAKASLSKPKTLVFDLTKLIELASPEVVEMVTTRVIDKGKLEAAMKIEAIDNHVVDAISSYEPQTPRLTVKRLKDEASF